MKLVKSCKKRDELFGIIIILLIAAINIFRLLIIFYHGVPDMGDHVWIWTECRIAWYGVSPYEALRENLVVNGLQTFPHVSTLPWGLTLSTIIHGAFLALEWSKVWYIVINLLAFSVMLLCVNKKIYQCTYNQSEKVAVNILLFSSWYYLDGIVPLNNGMLVSFLIIIAICIIDENEYLAGIIMLFTMIKPQNAIPFFFVFLILKKWKTIFVSVIGVLVSWGISAVWTQESPLDQLYGVISFASNPEESYHVVGIFDSIRKLGAGSMTALLLSMLMGILLLILTISILQRNTNEKMWLIYSIPAIVSVMWCYKSNADYLILIIPSIAIFEIMTNTERKIEWLIYLLCIVLLQTKPFSTSLLGKLPFMTAYMCNRADLYMKTLTLLPIIYGGVKTRDQNCE